MSLVSVTRDSPQHRRLRIAGFAALVVLALLVPFFFGAFRVSQFTLVLIYAIAVLGLNLLVGYSGQISLGHGAFFALGAYVGAILITRTGVPHLLTIPAAGAVAFLAGLALGVPALRLRGLYLALVTLTVAIATPVLIKRFDGLTGGSQGITVPQPAPPESLGLADDQFIYLITLVVALPLFAFAAGIVRRDVGRALIAMRDDETAARTMGINLATFKTRAFGLSAAYAGVAGALFVFSNGFVAPESFTLVVSFSFLAAIVVGGLATVAGALFGALFIVFVPVYASDVNEALSGVIYGAALIACMYVFRGGVMGLLRKGFERVVEVQGSTNDGRGSDEVHEVAVDGAGRHAGAGTGGVRS
ncbi:MAG: branched-chain amino acid ABC transporter permease [Actinomycetota bacterium]|nr:branched-chain amino acid ABC transporter permease [Actinomycetota bacterium]